MEHVRRHREIRRPDPQPVGDQRRVILDPEIEAVEARKDGPAPSQKALERIAVDRI
jgi:hypothetical protein